MELVIQGLRIKTGCRYVKFTQARNLSIYEEGSTSSFNIEFPLGFLSKDLIDNRIEVLSSTELHSTDYIKIENPEIDLNGLKLIKVTNEDYVFSQFIVDDLDQFTMNYDESRCEVLIPQLLKFDIPKYICLIGKNPYLKIKCHKNLKELCNFNLINFRNKNITIKSDNKFQFSTKNNFTKYLLQEIDVLDSFITKLRAILHNFGLELLTLPIDTTTKTVHRVTYRFTELNRQMTHKTSSNPLRYAVRKTAHVEFKLSTPDLVLFTDFKNRYQNLDLVTNFTQFNTKDTLNRDWLSSVFWQPIDTSFNQDYNQDEQGNIAFEASFAADLNYYVVYDEAYYNIQKTILSIESKGIDGITIKI